MTCVGMRRSETPTRELKKRRLEASFFRPRAGPGEIFGMQIEAPLAQPGLQADWMVNVRTVAGVGAGWSPRATTGLARPSTPQTVHEPRTPRGSLSSDDIRSPMLDAPQTPPGLLASWLAVWEGVA